MARRMKIWMTGMMWTVLLLFGCANNDEKKAPPAETAPAPKDTVVKKTVVFYGNSLTAGYGVEPPEAFPSLVQNIIDSLKLDYKVVNAGVSGETTAGGKSRIDWILKQPVNIFVLELGGNDGLRGIPITETSKNLQAIIDRVKAKYPEAKIVLAGMQVPPNMGKKYATEFREVFNTISQKNNAVLIPFLLEDVGGIPELNQGDGIHPNPQGHRIVANNVWKILQPLL